jgi:hypothetical protein
MKRRRRRCGEALSTTAAVTPAEARERILELEKSHGVRRSWVWAKLGRAPLARALAHLVAVAQRTAVNLGGSTAADMVNLYVNDGWRVDAEALDAMAAVTSAADVEALSRALNALYRPWLEAAAEHLQALLDKAPLPCSDHEETADLLVDEGGLILFADGLRYDVAQRLVERTREKGRSVTLSTRWAGLPTVTATAKPAAVSPVAKAIEGLSLGEDFLPAVAAIEKPLTTDRFRKLLAGAGYQYLSAHETGEPSGRVWTEDGELDKLGHSLQRKLANRIDEQVDLLLERIESLLDAGWNEIRVVTDHGWLWLLGGLPKVVLRNI